MFQNMDVSVRNLAEYDKSWVDVWFTTPLLSIKYIVLEPIGVNRI